MLGALCSFAESPVVCVFVAMLLPLNITASLAGVNHSHFLLTFPLAGGGTMGCIKSTMNERLSGGEENVSQQIVRMFSNQLSDRLSDRPADRGCLKVGLLFQNNSLLPGQMFQKMEGILVPHIKRNNNNVLILIC